MARTEDSPGTETGSPAEDATASPSDATVPVGDGSDHELDALAEADVEGIPAVGTPRRKVKAGGLRSALESVAPRSRFAEQRDVLGGAGQNVIGLAAGVLATFVTQIVMTRTLGASIFGVVTITTQFAFIASTATRFGMDVANVRLVAILAGRGETGRVKPLVRKSVYISSVVSVVVGLVVFLLAGW